MAHTQWILYFAPRKKDYRLFVQSHSPDFAPDTENDRLVLERVLKAKRRKHAVLMGQAPPEDGGRTEPLAWQGDAPAPTMEPVHAARGASASCETEGGV